LVVVACLGAELRRCKIRNFRLIFFFIYIPRGEETQKVASLTLALKMEIRQNMRKRLFGAKIKTVEPVDIFLSLKSGDLAEIGSFRQSTVPNFVAVLLHTKILFILAFLSVLFFLFLNNIS